MKRSGPPLVVGNILLVWMLIALIGLIGTTMSSRGAGREGLGGILISFWEGALLFLIVGAVLAVIATLAGILALRTGGGIFAARTLAIGTPALVAAVVFINLGAPLLFGAFGALVGVAVRLPRARDEGTSAA